MKKVYEAPTLEIEIYELDASIASNCYNVVNNGPEMGEHKQCDDYKGDWGEFSLNRNSDKPHNVTFYEDTNCDCYTTGGTQGFWTS